MKANFLLAILFCGYCMGCASVSVVPEPHSVFYPAPPEEPRLQYLTSFSSSRDIEGDTGAFSQFVLGEVPEKPIVKPYGVTVDHGRIYVADTVLNSIEVLDLNKKSFEYFSPRGGAELRSPTNLGIASDGKMYIADARRGQVLIFNTNGEYVSAIGSAGELKPSDVKIWGGRIFICDLKTQSVRVYDAKNHDFLFSIPPATETEKEAKVFSPTNIFIDTAGEIYVSDTGGFCVKKYDSGGKLLNTLGLQGDSPGQFARPKGVAVDREGRVFVVDAAFENVQIFDTEGKLLLFFPDQEEYKLVLPAGIAIDYENISYFKKYIDQDFEVEYLVLVASQYGERKISVFGFGKKR
ncbi:MAG: 6-bladed beta-propeller [Candidatus Omnitrophica bacterium]|nr:6-bladed beta-propeller [Candidatus Omnitrophota bacterium]